MGGASSLPAKAFYDESWSSAHGGQRCSRYYKHNLNLGVAFESNACPAVVALENHCQRSVSFNHSECEDEGLCDLGTCLWPRIGQHKTSAGNSLDPSSVQSCFDQYHSSYDDTLEIAKQSAYEMFYGRFL